MAPRVGNLARAAALGFALLSGCALSSTGTNPPENGLGRDMPPGTSRPDPAAVAQSLPPDWSIREPAPGDPAVKQVHYPEGQHDHDGVPGHGSGEAAGDAKEGKTPGTDGDEPGNVLEFQLTARTEPPLVQALRCYMEHRPAEALELLKSYDRVNQDMLLCLLPLAARLTEVPAVQVKPEEAAAWVDQLHSLVGPLQERAPLKIEKMCFCQWIKQFGRFEPQPDNAPVYQAGSGGRPGALVLVYAEVRNFASQRKGPLYETRLASWAEFYDYDGKKVGPRLDFGDEPDLSRSPRQDYFITYRFSVPHELQPGRYVLHIYVQDRLAPESRPVEHSLDFQVVAGGAGHGSRGEPSVAAK
jgi:hypothetical protein